MKKLIYIISLIAIILALIVPTSVYAADGGKDSNIKTSRVNLKVGDKVKFSKDVIGVYQGIDKKTGRQIFTSTIEAPIYNDKGDSIDCQWYKQGGEIYRNGDNLFSATVEMGNVVLDNGKLIWTPKVYLTDKGNWIFAGGQTIEAVYKSSQIIDDYINSNYKKNILRLTYNADKYTFYRDLRLIEGVICEYYYLPSNPEANIEIYSQVTGEDIGRMSNVSAWDADYKSIEVQEPSGIGSKLITRESLNDVNYPVIIEPSATYYSSAGDGQLWGAAYEGAGYPANTYNYAWTLPNGTVSDSTIYATIGQSGSVTGSGYQVWNIFRTGLPIDTSGLPDDATLTSAVLSLYMMADPDVDFDVTIQNGQPTYPHNPLQSYDYDKSNYSGDGGHSSTATWTNNAYNSITLDATGRSWISKTGYTKFMIRSSEDISGTSITGNTHHDIMVYTYEYGSGRRPRLVIEYSIEPPTVETNAATAVACTTATLNGEIVNTGGESNDIRGFVWDTTSRADPGNLAPALTLYANNWTEAGTFGIGEFYHGITALANATPYYARAVSHNSDGYSYGDEVTFTTWGSPTVTLNAPTNITATTARLLSYLNDDGNTECEVRFGWGTTDKGNVITDYDHYSTYSGEWITGQNPYLDIDSLTAATLYYYNVQVLNDCGNDTGTVSSFTTESVVGSPTNVTYVATATTISLSWTKGKGASETVIRYMVNDCPVSETDGELLYQGAASAYEHEDLISGNDYCYYIVGYDETEGYSVNHVLLHATTIAGVISNEIVTSDIDLPTNWRSDPDIEAFTDTNPVAPIINALADNIGMPQNWFWALSLLIGMAIIGFLAYKFSHSMLAPAIVIIMASGFGGATKLLPVYVAVVMAIIAFGMIAMQFKSRS